jgi:hypothetical protein
MLDHWLIRVGDGENLMKSRNYQVYGLIPRHLAYIKQIKPGDIVWFITPKKHGGIIIAMATFVRFVDRREENLIQIESYTNEELSWPSEKNWDIQIYYKEFYDLRKLKIPCVIISPGIVLNYKKCKDNGKHPGLCNLNLDNHYNNIKFYAEPIK